MAKKTIEELKERFKTGMFPTQSDYEDVFDSILTAVTTDDVNGVGEDREKTLTQMLESIDTSRIPGLDDFIRNVESFLAGIEVNKTLVELLEGLKKEIEYTAGNGININDNVISANTDVLVTKSDLDRKAERSELNSIKSTVLDLESRKAERSELNSKANVSEIPDVSNFITRDDIPEIPDTSNFATRDEIPTIPENVSAFNNDAGYLTEHQDLSNYATKSEIPDVSNFVTSEQIPNTDEFVTRGELPNFSEFATTSQLDDKADRSELPDVSNFATTSQLDNKADRSELPDWTQFATTSELNEKANQTDFDNLETRVTTLENSSGSGSGSGSGVTQDDLNNLETRVTTLETDIDNKVDNTDYNTSINSLFNHYFNLEPRVAALENSGSGSGVTQDDLNNLETNINTKADKEDLNNLETLLNEKASRDDLNNLETRVTTLENSGSGSGVTQEYVDNKISEASTTLSNSITSTYNELDEKKADRSELPNISELATKSELDNKADRSEIPSLEGYATEEYVNNAVANAGGSSNSGNYLKLVNDLDNYEFAKGEIVKYNGNTGTYINGADYQQKETTTNGILIPAGSYKANFGDQYRDLEWSERSNGLFLSTPNGYFTNISDEDYSIKILLYDSASKIFCVPSDVKVGDYAITNLTGTAISFEKVTAVGQNNSSGYPESITIYGKGVFSYNNCLKKGEGGYINGNLFVGNTSYPYLYITYVDGISHMFVAESYNNAKGSQTNEDIYLSGETIKSIELTDFCKRALNIE